MKTLASRIKRTRKTVRRSKTSGFGFRSNSVREQQSNIHGILNASGVQAKLTIGQPHDQHEQEADQVANRVIAMPEPAIQRQPQDEEETAQSKPLADQVSPMVQKQSAGSSDEEEPVQAKSNNDQPAAASAGFESSVHNLKGGGQPLDAGTRSFFEPRFGYNFSQVRVHTDSQASESAQSINAQAYTHGNDIAFGSTYSPGGGEGRKLLAHELTHVVQQSSNIRSRVQPFRARRVAQVSSLKIQQWQSAKGRPATNWANLQKRMKRRTKIISEWVGVYGNKPVMTRLSGRWSSLSRRLGNPRFDPAKGGMPSVRAMAAAMANETSDLATVKTLGKKARFVAGEIKQFIRALSTYTATRIRLGDEVKEFHRMDNLFTNPDVDRLVANIKHRGVRWTNADVKAVVSRETGDLADTTVVGIQGKRRGILSPRVNRSAKHKLTFIGMGQHGVAARTDAIKWAKGHGVVIATKPDPRKTPAESIKLTAAYMGWIADRMYNGLPAPAPTRDEFKKFVFAGYNWGQGKVLPVIRAARKGQRGRYTWASVSAGMRKQTREYVHDAVASLS